MSDVLSESPSVLEASPQGRRLHILQAATQCFARNGFHGTSMHEICQAAGMSPGALYRYFRSKDEIIGAIADEERGRNLTIISRHRPTGQFRDHLVALGLEFLREMGHPMRTALMAEVFAESLRNPEACARFKQNTDECKVVLGTLVAEAVASGEIPPVADMDFVLSALMATGEGIVMRMAFDPTLTLERAEGLIRLVVAGLFPEPLAVS